MSIDDETRQLIWTILNFKSVELAATLGFLGAVVFVVSAMVPFGSITVIGALAGIALLVAAAIINPKQPHRN